MEPRIKIQSINNLANSSELQTYGSKKVWQTPTVQLISVAGGSVPGGTEGVITAGAVFPSNPRASSIYRGS